MREVKRPDWAKKRAGRIAKRCIPEVVEAIKGGYLSSSSADKVYRYLTPEAQRERIAHLVTCKDHERERCRVAVKILKAHVQSGLTDLHGLRKELAALPYLVSLTVPCREIAGDPLPSTNGTVQP